MSYLFEGNTFYIHASTLDRSAQNNCVMEVFKPDESAASPLSILLTFRGSGLDPSTLSWDAFEEALQQFNPAPYISIGSSDDSFFRWVLESILQKTILSQMVDTRRIRAIDMEPLYGGGWHHWNQEYVLSAPEHHSKGDAVITLTPAQRVEWLLRRSAHAQDAYLQELLAPRKKAEPTGPRSQHTLVLDASAEEDASNKSCQD